MVITVLSPYLINFVLQLAQPSMIRNNPCYLQDTTSSVHVYLAFIVSMSDHTPKLIGTYSHEFT